MTPLQVGVCTACGRCVFPPRSLCPECGGAEWVERATAGGVVEETTMLRRVPGADVEPVAIGTVRLDEGPVVVARLHEAGTGARVGVGSENGAPVARPA